MPLTDSVHRKLDDLSDRFEEIAVLLADPDVVGDRQKFTALSKEYAEIEPVIAAYKALSAAETELAQAPGAALEDGYLQYFGRAVERDNHRRQPALHVRGTARV